MHELRELIDRESDGPVLSVFCRTDPREPANMSDSPGWLIALRNGLRDLIASADGDPEVREAAQRLGAEAERRLTGVSAADRGRSVALFLSAGGELDRFETFQIPVRDDLVSLERFKDHWGEDPGFDRVRWERESDPKRRAQRVFSGEADLAADVPWIHLEATSDCRLITAPSSVCTASTTDI